MAKNFLGKVRWVNSETLETAIDIVGCTITFRLDGENAKEVSCQPQKPRKFFFEAAKVHATRVLLDHKQRNQKRSA